MPTNLRLKVDQGAPGLTELAAAVPGNRHTVYGFMLTFTNAATFKFTDGIGDLTGAMSYTKDAPPVSMCCPMPMAQTAINSPLNLVTTGGAAKGFIIFLTEP